MWLLSLAAILFELALTSACLRALLLLIRPTLKVNTSLYSRRWLQFIRANLNMASVAAPLSNQTGFGLGFFGPAEKFSASVITDSLEMLLNSLQRSVFP